MSLYAAGVSSITSTSLRHSTPAVVFDLFTDAQLDALDLFDRLQLQAVLAVCRESKSAADAGRKLFAATRKQRSSINDSDRLRKYLGRFGLDWARLRDVTTLQP
jgi:transcriptional regulatory protein RtcR